MPSLEPGETTRVASLRVQKMIGPCPLQELEGRDPSLGTGTLDAGGSVLLSALVGVGWVLRTEPQEAYLPLFQRDLT